MTSARVELIRRRVAALSLRDETSAAAVDVIAAADLPTPEQMLDQLRKEWTSDMVADLQGPHYAKAASDPDARFLDWLAQRVRNPFHVSWRAVDRVARLHGTDAAVELAQVVWPQEIAWAQRMRTDENPKVAVLSGLFIRDAIRNPSNVYFGLAAAWMDEMTGSAYRTHPNRELTPEQIRVGRLGSRWRPAFLRFAERTYTPIVKVIERPRLEALAQRAFRLEMDEVQTIQRRETAESFGRVAAYRRLSVVAHLAGMGFSSNDIVHAYRVFLAEVSDGTFSADGKSADVAFLSWASERRGPLLAPVPTAEEELDMLGAVDALGVKWALRVPREYREAAGSSKDQAFVNWKADVLAGLRPAPIEPLLDYGHFLAAQRLTRAAKPGGVPSRAVHKGKRQSRSTRKVSAA